MGDAQVTVKFSPDGARIPDSETSNGVIAQVLNQAQENIDFALFVFSDPLTLNQLRQSQETGVQIQGIVDAEFAYREYSNTLDLWGIELADEQCKPNLQHSPWQRPLTRIGVPILGPTDKLHHKEGSC